MEELSPLAEVAEDQRERTEGEEYRAGRLLGEDRAGGGREEGRLLGQTEGEESQVGGLGDRRRGGDWGEAGRLAGIVVVEGEEEEEGG